jgi:hypothetical protein
VAPLCRYQTNDLELLHVAALRALRQFPPDGALVVIQMPVPVDAAP